MSRAQAYADPYVAGTGLGLVLLASFVFAGRGLGASGAFTTVAAKVTAASNLHQSEWLLLEIGGVIVGGFLSALFARRLHWKVENKSRMSLAFAGGAVMGLGAVLARGCTSGLALTGGALLSVGGWVFMIAAFAGAYMLAPFVRRSWQ
ncbi:MAG TPA: YeeE/YedE thiosulfate transporter family protein [Thermoanaerobaculia bacterium]